jgi:hypothetical protein
MIEQIHLRRTTVLTQLDDGFCLAWEVPLLRTGRIARNALNRSKSGTQQTGIAQGTRERERAEAAAQ